MIDKLATFIRRMEKLSIDIKFTSNYPWIYIDKINNKKVSETFKAKHGFTIAFLPIRNDQEMEFTDISEIFKLIRKYIKK